MGGQSNEITAVPKLLEMLALPGMVVTAAPMHCPRRLSQQVLDQGADCIPALKTARLKSSKGSMRGKLKRAGWYNSYLATLLSRFTKIHM